MKERLLDILRYFARPISMERLIDWSGQRVLLPFYHVVGEEEDLPHIRHLYQLRSVGMFERDLDFFLGHFLPPNPLKGGSVLALNSEAKENPSSLFRGLGGKKKFLKLGGNSKLPPNKNSQFHLTFDDGLSEIYHTIAPILKRKGIPATFFLNSDFVDNKDLFFRYKASLIIDFCLKNGISKGEEKKLQNILGSTNNLKESLLKINYANRNLLDKIAEILEIDFDEFLKKRQPYLTSEQIKKLQKDGFHFGGHSVDHPLFYDLELKEQLRQAAESVQFVKERFGEKTGAFAFPFTDFGVKKEFFEAVHSNNYFDISFGTAGLKIDSQKAHYQRFPMEGNLWSASDLVKTEYLYFILKRMFGKHKIER